MRSPFSIYAGGVRARAIAAEPSDSVPGFRSAAPRRWEDGMMLVDQPGAETAAIYLLGYSAELALKVALCELYGVLPTGDPLRQVTALAGASLGDVRTHDIGKLWKHVSDRRQALGFDQRDQVFHGLLLYHAWVVYQHWWEELRYKNVAATSADVVEVAESAFWLVVNMKEIYQ